MNIFILEDDLVQQSRLEKIIHGLLKKHQLQVKRFEISGKPNQLLGFIEEKGSHQLFFLDIEIKSEETKGIEVAQQIRDIDPYAIIVFVTTHSEFMPLSFRYKVTALDYIDKELETTEFESRIEEALLYTRNKDSKTISENCFYFKSKYAQVQFPFNEIYYIETSSRPHRVVLYTKTERMEFTASLSEILKQDQRLIQCHRSFAINPANVIKVDRQSKTAYFEGGANCSISRQKLNLVLKNIANLH